MALDRHAAEQDAQKFLKKGEFDEAIVIYKKILKEDVRDRRMRQKLADLYERVGRIPDAEKHYEELVRLYSQDGNHRAALAVHKQLVKLAPKNMERVGALGEAHLEAGFPNDAGKCFAKAIDGMASKDPGGAARYAVMLQEIQPGDLALRIRTAELYSSARKKDEAYAAYVDVIAEMRRRGRLDEVGRMATQALVIRPEEPDLLQDAADACLAVDDASGALKHLQMAYQNDPRDARTLSLLARAFEMGEDAFKARPILVSLAAVCEEKGDYAGRAEALERALAAGEADEALQQEAVEARALAEVAAFRLTELDSLVPDDEEEGRRVVRGIVMYQYGLIEQGYEELARVAPLESDAEDEEETDGSEANGAESEEPEPGEPDWSVGARAVAAEFLLALDRPDEALEHARIVLAAVDAKDRSRVEQRIATMEGRDLSGYTEELEPVSAASENAGEVEPASAVEEEALAEEGTDSTASTVSSEDPPVAGLEDEPGAEVDAKDAFDKDDAGLLGSIFSGSEGTLSEIDPDTEGGSSSSAPIKEATGLLNLGLVDDALAALEGHGGLLVAALRARCLREGGDPSGALSGLRDALDDIGEEDEGYPNALFELADLTARMGKHRAALRYLRELEELNPGFRTEDVSGRIQTIRGLLGS